MRGEVAMFMLCVLAFSGTAQADGRQGRHDHGNVNVIGQDTMPSRGEQQSAVRSNIDNGSSFVGVIYKGDSTASTLPMQAPPRQTPRQVIDPFNDNHL